MRTLPRTGGSNNDPECENVLLKIYEFLYKERPNQKEGMKGLIYRWDELQQDLSVLLPQISELVCGRRDQELEAKLRLLSPPSEQEANELGLDMSSDAQIVNEIIRNEWTSAALRCIADKLTASERSAVVAWAEAQATEQQIPVNLLLGDVLLKPTESLES